MSDKMRTRIISNLVGLVIFILINFMIYHDSFNFWQTFWKGTVFLFIFNIFSSIFKRFDN